MCTAQRQVSGLCQLRKQVKRRESPAAVRFVVWVPCEDITGFAEGQTLRSVTTSPWGFQQTLESEAPSVQTLSVGPGDTRHSPPRPACGTELLLETSPHPAGTAHQHTGIADGRAEPWTPGARGAGKHTGWIVHSVPRALVCTRGGAVSLHGCMRVCTSVCVVEAAHGWHVCTCGHVYGV